jgi:TetR/AcrR family transcriptional regulator, repressor of fatR-cypB operon
LFTKQGFHGTPNGKIARKAGISESAIYTYFPSKEAIFSSLARHYRKDVREWLKQTLQSVREPFSRSGLKQFAMAVQAKMDSDPEYLLLILSDVIEFENRHFLEAFHNVPRQIKDLVGPAIDEVGRQPGWRGHDPAFVLASVYMYYFTYALVERHMQGQQHLGLDNDAAMEHLIDLLTHGFWSNAAPRPSAKPPRADEPALKAMRKSNRERVEYLRFLSGRLWHSPPDVPPARNEAEKRNRPAMLFLPKISRDCIDDTQQKVEAAALELFTRQGFHGTNVREISKRSGVSQGAIYSYYSAKEAIFEGLVRSYRRCMAAFLERVVRSLEEPFSRDDLRFFATAIRSMMYDDPAYWLLIYIDVIEFKNRHFAANFHDIPEKFRQLLGSKMQLVRCKPGWCGHDPGLAMSIFYFYLCTYFTIERLMHGNRHLGVSEDEAVERLIDLFLHGLWSTPAELTEASQFIEPRRRPASSHVSSGTLRAR